MSEKEVAIVLEAVRKHHELYQSCLPMIASENITSNIVRKLLASDLSHRYAEGDVGNRYYQGCEFIDVIEAKAIALAKRLFEAEHVNLKPVSGVLANIAAFFALGEPFDRVMALSIPNGGHISYSKYSAAGLRAFKIIEHPFDPEEMNIDANEMVRVIRAEKPKIIVFGGSLFLFPHPVSEARDAADEVGARIIYDASHVLGLIAGGFFQEPLREGADVVTGSTHKTFPGPQGALILCRRELKERVDTAVFPGTVSNHHLHHIASLAVALAEMLAFGKEYAKATIENAKSLAQALYEAGFNVLCEHKGFTESHQVVMDVSTLGGGDFAAKILEKANIIANKNMLPWDREPQTPSGLRLGVQELTRLGMRPSEMKDIAALIRKVLIERRQPEVVRTEVVELRRNFQKVHFCFDSDSGDAYECPV
ncbi:MAG: Glycine/serine hydroxymethyltransferase [Candidatus Alkanophagales archaeon MCA70_species_2]|nr:Glycine/serine hydroxymethyltransferase [Candidatus Alkanophaga liquidiphilum]